MCSSRGNEVFVLRGLIGICFCIDEKHRSRDQADAKFALLKYRRQISKLCIYIVPPIFAVSSSYWERLLMESYIVLWKTGLNETKLKTSF
jgi:hypothetical protein